MRTYILLTALACWGVTSAHAASDSAGKAIAIGLPIEAAAVTLLHDWDWQGVKQLALDEGLDVATVLVLKQIVHEQRPNHADFKSFPSLTTAALKAPELIKATPLSVS